MPACRVRARFDPPPAEAADEELLHERVNTTVTSLLGLIGVDGDPVRSREHILISTILADCGGRTNRLTWHRSSGGSRALR